MEERGIVTPPEGVGRVRHVLVTAGDLLDDDDEEPPFDPDDEETADEKDEEFSRFPV